MNKLIELDLIRGDGKLLIDPSIITSLARLKVEQQAPERTIVKCSDGSHFAVLQEPLEIEAMRWAAFNEKTKGDNDSSNESGNR